MADRPEIPPGISPEAPDNETQWRAAGDRIQTLLDSCASNGAVAHERAQQLVREVVGLYGAGLQRIMRCLEESGDRATAERLATDDLVASLLLVHGLHPHGLRRRVSEALDRVRPYLGSHGGDVDLLEIDGDTVRLAFTGSCKSCPSSAVTLELAVEDAVRAAAPEISSIEVVPAEPHTASVIPADSLFAQVHSQGSSRTTWHAVPELAELRPGEVGGFAVGAMTVLACRVGEELFVYRDHCPVCDDTLAGADLWAERLRCPRCRSQFDVVRAGAGLDGAAGTHLEPLPLLSREGVLSIALRGQESAPAMGAPA